MSIRISSIEISGFRGIPQLLKIDLLTTRNATPASLILAGDNGVGKSSIVDAFEFALQARIDRNQNIFYNRYPLYVSLKSILDCRVKVQFSDGTAITRGIFYDRNGELKIERTPHPSFAISPFILRRADILRFWNVKDIQRKTVFFDYLLESDIDSDFIIPNKLTAKAAQKHHTQALRRVLRNASSSITEAFIAISPAKHFINSIELIQGKRPTSLALKVNLKNGESFPPHKILSESNLDLLALLIFLAFSKESARKGQAKFLILDDVMQSVDASIRVLVTEYILNELKDWQFFFTVHDRLWLEQLRTIFRQKNTPFVEGDIVRWDFDTGPLLIIGNKDIGSALVDAVTRGDRLAICSQAGLLLENISNTLSYKLPIAVPRRKGDKYSLGDLWPGIVKTLSKTSCRNTVENVDRWLHLRNLVGAHYNEWAQSLSGYEAQSFGESVLALLQEVRCSKCFWWVERQIDPTNGQSLWACHCGNKLLRPSS